MSVTLRDGGPDPAMAEAERHLAPNLGYDPED